MITLKSTKKEAPKELKIGVFGQSGVGKTTLVKTLPCEEKEVIVLNIENGLEVLRGNDFSQIDFDDIEAQNPINKMREVVKFLRTPEGLNGFKWLVIDSFTMWAEKVQKYMESHPSEFGLLTKAGAFDGLRMYGELKKVFGAVNDALLNIPHISKLVLFGAMEKADGPDVSMQLLIAGSFSNVCMFGYDDFYGMRVVKSDNGEKRELITGHDGYWIAKSRMSGGSKNPLELYEEANIGNLIKKCYS